MSLPFAIYSIITKKYSIVISSSYCCIAGLKETPAIPDFVIQLFFTLSMYKINGKFIVPWDNICFSHVQHWRELKSCCQGGQQSSYYWALSINVASSATLSGNSDVNWTVGNVTMLVKWKAPWENIIVAHVVPTSTTGKEDNDKQARSQNGNEMETAGSRSEDPSGS